MVKTSSNSDVRELGRLGFKCILGADEAGMGPLAGPVVVAVVQLPDRYQLKGIRDSKLMTEKQLSFYNDMVREKAIRFAIEEGSVEEINRVGLRPTLFAAYRRAIARMNGADFILVDALTIPELDIRQRGIIKGDMKVTSIAAASVLAKVHRDNLMREADKKFPSYGFAKHKGYGTKQHMAAIRTHGACPLHRVSWRVFERLSV